MTRYHLSYSQNSGLERMTISGRLCSKRPALADRTSQRDSVGAALDYWPPFDEASDTCWWSDGDYLLDPARLPAWSGPAWSGGGVRQVVRGMARPPSSLNGLQRTPRVRRQGHEYAAFVVRNEAA